MSIIATLIHKCIFISIITFSCALGMLYYVLNNQYIDFSSLEHYNPGKATIVLDDQGIEWTRFQLDKRDPITLELMPSHLLDAFLAAEDWSFFSHQGISFKGIMRSIVVNMYHGRKAQGASTITQQLVKLLFFNQNKTFTRKLKEQVCALVVEQQFTKQHILQTYLNHIYFGCGIYGVQAASQRFWGIDAADLSIDQAATLAAIVRSPARYCPLLHPLSCQKRRNIILQLMHQRQFIDKKTYTSLCDKPIAMVNIETDTIAPHLRETLRIFLEDLVGKNKLYSDGFIVQTTLNKQYQCIAQKAFNEHCKKLKKELNLPIDGGLIALETKTGEIKALVGGCDFIESQYNRALQARRQMGSVLKPLIYAAALEKGINFTHTEYDEPFSLLQPEGAWEPKNYNDRFNGKVTLAYALSRSNNIVAIKTLMSIGAQSIVNLAKECHIKGPFHTYPSLALGCIDATLAEVAGMFNVFADNGIYTEPHFIRWVKNSMGTKLIKNNTKRHFVMPSRISDQVAYVLKHGLQRLRYQYKRQEWIKSEAISKTGTTNNSRTCWFVGSTPSITTAVYIGCDDNRSMGNNVYPVKTAFPIWLAFHRSAQSSQASFVFDPSLQEIYIDQYTGQCSERGKPDAIKILV
ncbi:MAG: transglycosylase domain-containing protein [Candidatus Dependentiae bacterium]|nr:transglycosylase domain-containing protein [Candidatus Dependentiae bacterium]